MRKVAITSSKRPPNNKDTRSNRLRFKKKGLSFISLLLQFALPFVCLVGFFGEKRYDKTFIVGTVSLSYYMVRLPYMQVPYMARASIQYPEQTL